MAKKRCCNNKCCGWWKMAEMGKGFWFEHIGLKDLLF